jgi:hypothetical protein
MRGARYSLLLGASLYVIAIDGSFVLELSAALHDLMAVDDSPVVYFRTLWLHCSDIQQIRASGRLRYLAPAPRCCSACALMAHASYFVMAVEVSSFVFVSAPPRLYYSDEQQRRASVLLLGSAPAPRCCCARAVTAYAPLVFICCR